MGIKVTGLDPLKRRMTNVIQDHQRSVMNAARKIGQSVSNKAKGLAPVDHGSLTACITHEVTASNGKVAVYVRVPSNWQSAASTTPSHV